MRKVQNTTHIEGVLYQHALQLKVSGENSKNPGTQFINGTIDVATDDAMTNIVTVHFSYVTPTYQRSGSANATFNVLQNIINGVTCNVVEHGADKAAKLRIDSQIGLNEFFSNRSGNEELVSVRRNEGGFVHVVQTIAATEGLRDTFCADMIITKTVRQEADEERNRPERMIVSGYVFDFRNALLPVDFVMYDAKGMDHFEAFEASEKAPVFVNVNGHQVCKTVTTIQKGESNGWGESFAQEVTSTQREFVITGVKEPYEWDTEETITGLEYKEMKQAREVAVAEIKQRQDEYNASRAQTQAPAAATGGATGFNF